VACSSCEGEREERRGPLPASRFVIGNPVSPLHPVELLTSSPLQIVKPLLVAAPFAYRILVPSKIRGSDTVPEQCPDILTGIEGPHALIVHEQLGSVLEENRKGSSPRVNARSILDVRFVQGARRLETKRGSGLNFFRQLKPAGERGLFPI
jgi:hypothetical protein